MNIPGYNDKPVLFFDGVCNLCNGWVQFVIKRDKKKRIVFASLQSTYGQQAQEELRQQLGTVPDSLVLYYNNKFYTKSAAALKTAQLMGSIWQLAVAAWIVPGFIRNGIYDWVARNRYKWYGKKDTCMIPTPELSARFLPG